MDSASKRKRAVVFTGGGLFGPFQAGAILTHLFQDGKPIAPINKFAGISVGALGAAFMSSKDPASIVSMWESVYRMPELVFEDNLATYSGGTVGFSIGKTIRRFVAKYKLHKVVFELLSKGGKIGEWAIEFLGLGVLGNDGLVSLVKDFMKEKPKQAFFSGFVSLEDGQYYPWSSDDFDLENLIKATVASTRMPGVWRPEEEIRFLDGRVARMCVDAGISSVAPISQMMDYMKADGGDWDLYIFSCSNRELPRKSIKTLIDVASRSLDIYGNGVLTKDISKLLKKNREAMFDPTKISVNVWLCEPELGELEGILNANNIMYNYERGTKSVLKRID